MTPPEDSEATIAEWVAEMDRAEARRRRDDRFRLATMVFDTMAAAPAMAALAHALVGTDMMFLAPFGTFGVCWIGGRLIGKALASDWPRG